MKNTPIEILNKYNDHLVEVILIRFRIFAPIAILLHLGFFYIDYISYPHFASFFLQIRILDSSIIFILFLLTFLAGFKKYVVWFTIIGTTVFAAGMAYMVYCTDGSSSRYYEGFNLVILAMFFINPFYVKANLLSYLLHISFFETAMLLNTSTSFNKLNFAFANYFTGSTALLVLLMMKFYSDQYKNAFIHEEQLRLSEQKLALLYSKADRLSKTDELTKIHNRRHFSEMLNERIKLCEENKGTFYLVIFDIDYFKQINDQYGHAFGDEVLFKVAQLVKNSIRSNDFLGRFGGDEFVLCMDGITKMALINRLNKFSLTVRMMGLTHEGKPVDVSASFGAAQFKPGLGMTEKTLMEAADEELMNVKRTSRGHMSIRD